MENYSYKNAAVRVCFDNKFDEEFCGRIFTPYREEETEFHNVVTLMLELEAISEERGFPSATCINRRFKQKRTKQNKKTSKKPKEQEKIFHTMEKFSQEYGQKDTLLVYVTSRMHAGLQGHVACIKDEVNIPFESELDFIRVCEERFGRV